VAKGYNGLLVKLSAASFALKKTRRR
jgi:hypothetical protein